MKCPHCSGETPPRSDFCIVCGRRLGLTCASCATELPSHSKFCHRCGAPVPSESVAGSRIKSPESYIPRHLAEQINTSRASIEGERKQVTVLFADMKGSMELLAERDPEEAGNILDPVLERMMEAVHRFEGTVNQVMGDGIMALFGAPVAHEDHAVRACYAALRIRESVNSYAEDLQRTGAPPVYVRVGVNSGEVVVRSIGNDLRMDYTAIGQTVHLAARMEQIAKPGSILITGETLRMVEGYVAVRSLGPILVKGLNEAVDAYEVTNAGAVRTRLQRSAARGFTRFVGRADEMTRLAGCARSGQGRPRPSRGGRWRARGGKVPAALRVPALAPDGRVPDPRVRHGAVSQDDAVPADRRPLARVLSDRGVGRQPADPGEDQRQAGDARREPDDHAARVPRAHGCRRRGAAWPGPRGSPSSSANHRGLPAFVPV